MGASNSSRSEYFHDCDLMFSVTGTRTTALTEDSQVIHFCAKLADAKALGIVICSRKWAKLTMRVRALEGL